MNDLNMPSTYFRGGIDTDVTTDVLATIFVVTYIVFKRQALYKETTLRRVLKVTFAMAKQ